MKSGKRLAARAAPAAGAAFLLCVWAVGQQPPPGAPRVVTGAEGLRDEFVLSQLWAPPGGVASVAVDAGVFGFAPLGAGVAFGRGLAPGGAGGGLPVVLYEDPVSRETVFLNAAGAEAARLAPPSGYDPGWVAGLLYPDGLPDGVAAGDLDPARVVMTALLVPPEPSSAAQSGAATPAAAFPGGGVQAGVPETQPSALPLETPVSAAPHSDSGLPDGLSGEGASRSPAVSEKGTNPAPAFARTVFAEPKTVYVDGRAGRDSWSGLAARAGKADGPKRTLRSGLAAAGRAGKRMVVLGGVYGGGLDVRGTAVSVAAVGSVVLATSSDVPAAADAQSCASATGTVASVSE